MINSVNIVNEVGGLYSNVELKRLKNNLFKKFLNLIIK